VAQTSGVGWYRKASVTLHPYWRCAREGCPQNEAMQPMSAFARREAQEHVRTTGHDVVVTRETRDMYAPQRVGIGRSGQ
jgi:hypothetical protein